MKFIADVMLGKLAKRMRLLGFDVLYDPAYEDNEVLRLALEQDRIILTRDAGLASRPLAKNHILIESDRVDEQLHQVAETSSLPATAMLTRCSACNTILSAPARDEVRDLVSIHVYEQHRDFLRCETCGRIYWKGTHVRNMERFMKIK
jgi:uncharacterized protein with PIN domain